MDHETISRAAKLHALICEREAIVARVRGMEAQNNLRNLQEQSPAYDESAFSRAENELAIIADRIRYEV